VAIPEIATSEFNYLADFLLNLGWTSQSLLEPPVVVAIPEIATSEFNYLADFLLNLGRQVPGCNSGTSTFWT
jgi:hypothetical protein